MSKELRNSLILVMLSIAVCVVFLKLTNQDCDACAIESTPTTAKIPPTEFTWDGFSEPYVKVRVQKRTEVYQSSTYPSGLVEASCAGSRHTLGTVPIYGGRVFMYTESSGSSFTRRELILMIPLSKVSGYLTACVRYRRWLGENTYIPDYILNRISSAGGGWYYLGAGD